MKESRQGNREERRIKKRRKMPLHGKSLAKVYRDAIAKRTKRA